MHVRISPRNEPLPADLAAELVPGSKSHTQRAMLLAAFLPGSRTLRSALQSRDTEVLGRALDALGARCRWTRAGVVVTGRSGLRPEGTIDLDENGTALRALVAIVALLHGRVAVDGSPGLRARPLAALHELLRQGGVVCSARALPFEFDAAGAAWPLVITADARMTTQVATGALLGAALRAYWRAAPTTVRVLEPSAPEYLHLTVALLREFGFTVGEIDASAFAIDIGSRSTLHEVRIPRDPSSLAFVRALAAMHAVALPKDTRREPYAVHPDYAIEDDIARIVNARPGSVVELRELARRPDCFPALAALAATRASETRLLAVPALRAKESDRIAAMARALTSLGAHCKELPDGLVVRGPLAVVEPVVLRTAPDHRVVMALALLGTVLPQGLAIEHGECVDKSWPGYFEWLGRCAVVERD